MSLLLLSLILYSALLVSFVIQSLYSTYMGELLERTCQILLPPNFSPSLHSIRYPCPSLRPTHLINLLLSRSTTLLYYRLFVQSADLSYTIKIFLRSNAQSLNNRGCAFPRRCTGHQQNHGNLLPSSRCWPTFSRSHKPRYDTALHSQ